jgi:ribonuclease HI
MAKLANRNFDKIKKSPPKAKQEESIEKQLWKAADKLRKKHRCRRV